VGTDTHRISQMFYIIFLVGKVSTSDVIQRHFHPPKRRAFLGSMPDTSSLRPCRRIVSDSRGQEVCHPVKHEGVHVRGHFGIAHVNRVGLDLLKRFILLSQGILSHENSTRTDNGMLRKSSITTVSCSNDATRRMICSFECVRAEVTNDQEPKSGFLLSYYSF
jgi:hypothetical protein